uniref:Uncharacterized protein n=1 Tax=Fibrocapsa japonica TaxID=94617 RepID=A0A7S2UVX3_9STRA
MGGLAVVPAFRRPSSTCYNKGHLEEGVVLITYHASVDGTAGLLINKPTNFCLKDIIEPTGMEPFAHNPVFFGGCDGENGDVGFMHSHSNINGSREILPGLYIGGDIFEAVNLVHSGQACPEDFTFFLQQIVWKPGQLSRHAKQGDWHLAACSQELVERGPKMHATLWREIMRLLGGKYSLVARELYKELC